MSPRRVFRSARPFLRSPRRNRSWVGNSSWAQAAAAGTVYYVELASAAVLSSIGPQGVILRTIGNLTVVPDAANWGGIGVGIGVFNSALVASFPDPTTGAEEVYLYQNIIEAVSNTAGSQRTIDFDIRAKRRWTENDHIVLVVKGLTNNSHWGAFVKLLVQPDM